MEIKAIDELTLSGINEAVKYVETGFSSELDYQFYYGQINAYNHIRAANGLTIVDGSAQIDSYWSKQAELDESE